MDRNDGLQARCVVPCEENLFMAAFSSGSEYFHAIDGSAGGTPVVNSGSTDHERAIHETAAALEETLRAAGNERRGVGMKAEREKHLPNPPGPDFDLDYLGGTVPMIRKATKAALKARREFGREEVTSLATLLWGRDIYDLRLAAVETLMARIKLLEPADVPAIEPLIRESRTWALIDPLSLHVMAPLVVRHPVLTETLDRWAEDDDFWVRRTAMLSLLPSLRRGGGDFDRFTRYADAILEEREFFIRKAIGWVLREVSKKRPALVSEWLAPRTGRVSGVTFREAVKYLPAEERERLTAAFQEGRPA